jgi:hypothetical protein
MASMLTFKVETVDGAPADPPTFHVARPRSALASIATRVTAHRWG